MAREKLNVLSTHTKFPALERGESYLCSPGWPQTYNPYVFTTWVLKTQVYTTGPGNKTIFSKHVQSIQPMYVEPIHTEEDCSIQYY